MRSGTGHNARRRTRASTAGSTTSRPAGRARLDGHGQAEQRDRDGGEHAAAAAAGAHGLRIGPRAPLLIF